MEPVRRTRVAVVNDFEVVVDGLATFLSPFADRIEVLPTVAIDGSEAAVDVVVYDTFGRLGVDADGIRALMARPAVRSVAVHSFDDSEVAVNQALAAGATGHLSKAMTAAHLTRCLQAVGRGEQVVAGPTGVGRSAREERGWPGQELGLSEREAEVVALASVGHRNAEIASAIGVTIDTVKTHLARAFRKLDLHNRTALAALVHTHPSFRRLSAPVLR